MSKGELCSKTRNAVHEIFDAGQQRNAERSHLPSAAMLSEALDRTVAQHAEIQQRIARLAGCGIEFIIDAASVRETCVSENCPFSPNGPGSV